MDHATEIAHRIIPASGTEWPLSEMGRAIALEHGANIIRAELLSEIERLRNTLTSVMKQSETDLASAHAEICKLKGLDPAAHSWPEWSPQANSLRWFSEIRARFNLPRQTQG